MGAGRPPFDADFLETVDRAIVGLAAAVGVGYLIRANLYGLSPLDPVAYLAVIAVLGAAAVVSLALPAWRATRVDPLIALRDEG